jgi:hypothetical protein
VAEADAAFSDQEELSHRGKRISCPLPSHTS